MTRALILLLGLALAAAAPRHAPAQEPVPIAAGQMLTGRFVQERHLAGLGAPLRTEGQFLLVPGKGLLWRSEKPFDAATVITPSGLLQVVDGREVSRVPASRWPVLTRFYDMLGGALAGDWGAMERAFTTRRQQDGQIWRIELVPPRADDPVGAQIASITVSGRHFVEDVEIRRAGGDWEHLTFFDQVATAAALSPEDAKLFDAVGQ